MKCFKNIPQPYGMKREEIIKLLLNEEYGFLPPKPDKLTVVEVARDESFCAGKANFITLKFCIELNEKTFSFPVYYTKRVTAKKSPCFIHINFKDSVPDKYQPTEELVDNGYNILSFCYKDVSSDDGDFTNGLAGIVYNNGERKPNDCGKIGLWAWSAIRVMDYALTLPEINHNRISVLGHSRLGKTALLAGALEERFYCAVSNDSGCCGAALSRENTGETLEAIWSRFPFWFCEEFGKYVNKEESLPFDQHFLIAANTPHKVYVASALEDWWACPENEYAACIFAAPYFNSLGLDTFIPEDRPKVGDGVNKGYIGYHIRKGVHYLSREDWLKYINFLKDAE